MIRAFASLLLLAAGLCGAQPAPAPRKPKLVLAITVDQFRYDYLTRYGAKYTGGLNRLLTRGAVFTNANYEHSLTRTAVGHATYLSGALPSVSGIIDNEWFEPATGKRVTSVSDDSVKLLGGSTEAGASPRRLLVTTLGDELKIASGGKSRVIGVSVKDRSAILPVGHMADGAFWVEAKTGNIVSSSYFFPELPAWVKDLNGARPAEKYAGVAWMGHQLLNTPKDYTALSRTPFSNELVELIAERAIAAEKLGERQVTDLLAVSFSANDFVGHDYGPDSPEVQDAAVRVDGQIDKLFRFLDARIGMQNVLVVLTADHGIAPMPEAMVKRRISSGRMPLEVVQSAVQARLDEKYGKSKWILDYYHYVMYLDRDLIRQKGLDGAEMQRVAAEVIRGLPHVARVYTREKLLSGGTMADKIGQRVQNGYHPVRGGDLIVVLDPYWTHSMTTADHGTPYNYDSHVPLLFMGPGIKPGRYHRAAAPNDVAPTLSSLLEVEIPSGSSGRVLEEMLAAGY